MNNNKENSGLEKTKAVVQKIGKVCTKIGEYIFKFRSVLLAAPVVFAAVKLALYAQQNHA